VFRVFCCCVENFKSCMGHFGKGRLRIRDTIDGIGKVLTLGESLEEVRLWRISLVPGDSSLPFEEGIGECLYLGCTNSLPLQLVRGDPYRPHDRNPHHSLVRNDNVHLILDLDWEFVPPNMRSTVRFKGVPPINCSAIVFSRNLLTT
jgi:hypothetical protein